LAIDRLRDIAVHLRHLNVHQHEVDGPFAEQVDGLPAVTDDQRKIPPVLQQLDGKALVDLVVLGYQHRQPA